MEFEIISGTRPTTWFICLYGRPGIGKSTFASWAPQPLFIDIAGGLDRIDCQRTKTLKSWSEVEDALRFAYVSEFKTIVVDEVGALEELLTKKVLEEGGKASLGDFGYGKGYELLAQEWMKALKVFDKVRANDKNILFVGHDVIEKFQDPTSEDYDRYSINLHKKALTPFVGRMDAVFFTQFETFVKEKESKGKKRAVGGERRLLHTQNHPAYIAKNRFGLAAVEEFDRTFWTKLT